MKKAILVIATLLFALVPVWAAAQEHATPQEVYVKIVQAASVVQNLGEESFSAFNDPKGEFAWKDAYAFVTNCEKKTIVAHPNPKLINLPSDKVLCYKTGRKILEETCQQITPEGVWLEYWWPIQPGSDQIARKVVFVVPVPGTPYQVLTSIFNENDSLEDLNKIK
ncbi:MAG: cache domain-containing protein [Pseudomonadota bacterium]